MFDRLTEGAAEAVAHARGELAARVSVIGDGVLLVQDGDVVELTVGDRELTLSAYEADQLLVVLARRSQGTSLDARIRRAYLEHVGGVPWTNAFYRDHRPGYVGVCVGGLLAGRWTGSAPPTAMALSRVLQRMSGVKVPTRLRLADGSTPRVYWVELREFAG